MLYDRQTGKLALVMELLEDNLYEAFKGLREPLPEVSVQLIAFQCACGLFEMHRLGYMHRDNKPENFLLKTFRCEA